jgi:hypothetical protein
VGVADQLRNHALRRPRQRVLPDDPVRNGYFYPGEVAKLEGFTNIDYRQLRRLFKLVRYQADEAVSTAGAWSRYTLRDIAALRIAVGLCRISDEVESKYLLISPLERACKALKDQGVENPLLDVPMIREGRTIFAEVDGVRVDPTTGQMQLHDVRDAVRDYLDASDLTVPAAEKSAVRFAVTRESQRRRERTAAVVGYIALT